MSDATVSPIEPLGVDAIDLTHALRQGGAQGFDQQVVVIRHLAPRPNAPIEALTNPTQIVDEGMAVSFVEKDIALRIAPRHDVIERAFELDSQGAGHSWWCINGESEVQAYRSSVASSRSI